jgi:putative ABC transport system ATP-binding protein
VVEALRGVDIDLEGGRFTTISGPSGSGKSSLLRLIAGLDVPTEGTVEVSGVMFSSLGPAARRRKRRDLIGFVFQRPSDNLIAYLSVGDHARGS